jgi:hypothetical protein
VDDVDEDGLENMRIAGHRPAAIVATSPHCYQAWIRLAPPGAGPSHAVATEVAAELAAAFGGDPGAAHSKQLGRLPGFRNRKSIHERRDGSYPIATLVATCPDVDPDAENQIRVASGLIRLRRQLTPHIQGETTTTALCMREAGEEYGQALARIHARIRPRRHHAQQQGRRPVGARWRLLRRAHGRSRPGRAHRAKS